MKRSFVYLALSLTLSLLLCGCGSMGDRGNVTASPWPDVTEPVLPTPTAVVSPTPIPGTGNGTTDTGTDTPVGTVAPEMSTGSPNPAGNNR